MSDTLRNKVLYKYYFKRHHDFIAYQTRVILILKKILVNTIQDSKDFIHCRSQVTEICSICKET